jgi:8-oxo-dGTP diphosphatase
MDDYVGSKGALFLGDSLLVTLRDDFPGLPWAGHWDFVGGMREPGETPRETLVREAREEVGLDLSAAEWLWESPFPAMIDPARTSWFFVLRMPARAARGIVMGEEGQGWMLLPPERFLRLPRAVPSLQDRLKVWMDGLSERARAT